MTLVDFKRCWAAKDWGQCPKAVPHPADDPLHLGLCDDHYEQLVTGGAP